MKDELFQDLLASAQEMVDMENEVIVLSKEDAERFVGVIDAESLARLNELCKNVEDEG